MKLRSLPIAFTILVANSSLTAEEESRFPKVDGTLIVGKFVDLDDGGRAFIRFGSFTDSGAEITRESKAGTVLWRYYMKPLMIAHSSYRHEVSAFAKDGTLHVTSEGFKIIKEAISLSTGKKISRKVSSLGKQDIIPGR